MPQDLNDSFTAQSQLIKDILFNASHLYVPPYQRPYSWRKEDVEKLIWDLLEGVELLSQKDSYTFIGSLITTNAPNSAIEPHKMGENPPGIKIVIDGQQRLTTILMFCLVLQNLLEVKFAELEKSSSDVDSPELGWVRNHKIEIVNLLKGCLVAERAPHNGERVYYPRMIRAYEDMWARSREEAKYVSPLAKCINDFAVRMDDTRVYEPVNPGSGAKKNYREFNSRLATIQSHFISVANGINPEQEDPILADYEADQLHDILNRLGLQPEGMQLGATLTPDSKNWNAFMQIVRLITVSQYLLFRVTLANIDCKDEENAFAVFQSLNTTGLPLNAIETLVPQVIRAIGPREYLHCEEQICLEAVNKYILDFKSTQSYTVSGNLVIQFALSESGTKLSKSLFDQKMYLQKEFRNANTSRAELSAFVQRFRDIVDVDSAFRESSGLKTREIKESEYEDSELIFSFLKDLNHSIALAPINRFYHQAKNSSDPTDTANYMECLWAVSAFSCLWRASHGSTAGIDNRYRNLMSGGGKNPKNGIAQAFSSPPLLSELKEILLGFLIEDGINSQLDFINRAEYVDCYNIAPVARMLFLASHQNSTKDSSNPGLIKHANRDRQMQYMSLACWKGDDFATIEHIAPQSPNSDWGTSGIYEDPRLVNTLGNFVLVSQPLNSSFGNRSWSVKRVLYEALGAADYDTATSILQPLPKDLIAVATKELMLDQNELPQFSSLGDCTNFDVEFLKKRNRRLLGLAYDFFIAHLSTGD